MQRFGLVIGILGYFGAMALTYGPILAAMQIGG